MIGIVLKRWRADICKDYSLRIRKAQGRQMVCSLHIHLSCPAVWHRMRFRQCDLVPNSCLDTTFQIRVRNRDHLCGRRGAACDSKAIHGLLHSFVCRRRLPTGAGAGAGTPDKIQSAQFFLKTLNPFQVSKCLCYARMAPPSCTAWVDRAGCGPD